MSEVVNIKRPYAVWTVGDEEYKLKLTTSSIVDLETKYKCNLLELINVNTSTGVPALSVMLDVTHAALQKYHHGKKKADVYDMFDEYEDNGGSQLQFFMSVFLELYTVSGFFSSKMADQIRDELSNAQKDL